MISACGRKGELSLNALPEIEITSYEGDTTSVDLDGPLVSLFHS